MTIDEIAQKIYEERYRDPGSTELAAYMRDTMIREVVQRALDLATGGLAIELVEARRSLAIAHATWLDASEQLRKEQGSVEDAHAKARLHDDARYRWDLIVMRLDAWITGREQ